MVTMNCLACQTLPRTQSDREENKNVNHPYQTSSFSSSTSSSSTPKSCCLDVRRRWSSELTPPSYHTVKTDDNPSDASSHHDKPKNRRVRRDCTRSNEPRLVRSSGMRRDWSFEDLILRDQKKGRFH